MCFIFTLNIIGSFGCFCCGKMGLCDISVFSFQFLSFLHLKTNKPHIFYSLAMSISICNQAVVLDIGSGLCKAGFANQASPTAVFSTNTSIMKGKKKLMK